MQVTVRKLERRFFTMSPEELARRLRIPVGFKVASIEFKQGKEYAIEIFKDEESTEEL